MSRAHHKNRRRIKSYRYAYAVAIGPDDLPPAFKATHDGAITRAKHHRAGPVGWTLFGPHPTDVPGYTRDGPLTPAGDIEAGLAILEKLSTSDDDLAGAYRFINETGALWLVLAEIPVTRQ